MLSNCHPLISKQRVFDMRFDLTINLNQLNSHHLQVSKCVGDQNQLKLIRRVLQCFQGLYNLEKTWKKGLFGKNQANLREN